MGKSETKVKTELPQPTAEEQELARINVEAAEAQLQALERQGGFQRALFDLERGELPAEQARRDALAQFLSPEEIAALEAAETRRGALIGETSDAATRAEAERIAEGFRGATPEQKELIRELADATLGLGESDIRRFTGEQLALLSEELAPSLGLRATDTPILDRGGEIVEESIRQQGQLARTVRGGAAQAELDLPLQVERLDLARNQFQQNLGEAARQFSADLRQRAFQNRLALGSLNLGSQIPQALQVAQQPRLAQTTTTQKQDNLIPLLDVIFPESLSFR